MASRTSAPPAWRTRFSSRGTSPRRTACCRWTPCAASPAGSLAEILGPTPAGKRPRVAQAAPAAHRRGCLRHAACGRPRGLRRLHARRQSRSSPPICDNLPVEFTLLSYQPRPWSVVDCAADLPAHVSRPDHHLEGRDRQAQHAGARATAPRWSSCFRCAPAGDAQPGLERLGHRRQPHRVGQAAALERHAPGVFAARHLVHDAPGGARPGCRRASRCRARRASSWATTSGSPGASPISQFDVQDLYIEKIDERTGPLSLPRPGGTGAGGARDHPREGRPPRRDARSG